MQTQLLLLRHFNSFFRSWWRLRKYAPQRVTVRLILDWLSQFPFELQSHILKLLDDIIFYSEDDVRQALVDLNQNILDNLADDGIGIQQVIYVSIDKAGSSSPVMLNLLRDAANLERKGAEFADSKDERRLNELTNKLVRGAIIYVDDFSGSGKQFIRNRNTAFDYVVGSFSEFFIVPVMCQEAYNSIKDVGVVPRAGDVHLIEDRPLHPDCDKLDSGVKEQIIGICKKIHKKQGLGFQKLASMAVLYRNAPNTTPLLFRGSLAQNPYKGILPRHDDLPFGE